ncbi:MAG: SO_0444 family Cu/Zn efflux transporter [Methanosarcinales archaeon]|nr:SO_0444 family Cu/Zn efflux transporter [Methanosarcinales archaeon]
MASGIVITIVDILSPLIDEIWWIYSESAPYLLFGFLIAGFIHIFSTESLIGKHLGKGRISSVIKAAIIGVPLPLCSCGVVPTALSLRKMGATRGATTSFLISTPETGVDSIAITYALLDPVMTVFRPISAFITAVISGILTNLMISDKSSGTSIEVFEPCACGVCELEDDEKASIPYLKRIYAGMRFAFVELLGDMAKWLIAGMVIAGIISYLVPTSLIETFLGGNITSMLVMLIVGIPLYVCATASTPIAAALLLKGASPGAALVFLLAGPATNMATITMLYKFLGKKSLTIYLASIGICSVGLGMLLNIIYSSAGIESTAIVGTASDILPESVKTVAAIVLLLLIVNGIYRLHNSKNKDVPGRDRD